MDVHFRLKSSPSPIVRLLAVGRRRGVLARHVCSGLKLRGERVTFINDLWLLRSPRPLARAGQVGDLPYSLSTYR